MHFELLDALPLVDVVFEDHRDEAATLSSGYCSSGSLASKRSWYRCRFSSSVRRLESLREAMSFCVIRSHLAELEKANHDWLCESGDLFLVQEEHDEAVRNVHRVRSSKIFI